MRRCRTRVAPPVVDPPAVDTSSPTVAFLLSEINLIDEEFRRIRAEGATRTNSYLTVAATIATAAAAYTAQTRTPWWSIAVPAGLALFLLGLYVVFGMVIRDIESDRCARATGRIRHYFVELDADLGRYLTFQATDAPMPWVTRNQSVQRQTVIAVAAASGALAAAGGLAWRGVTAWVWLGVFVALAVVIGVVVHRTAGRKLRKTADRARREQRFP